MTDEESLRLAIAEEVSLAPYDPQRREAFVAERDRLLALFPGAILEIVHIGSTAVPGMPAKPIVDLLAGVASIEAADALVEPLCRAGYATSAEFNASLADRRWLMRWASGRRTHHLHIVVHGGQAWAERVAFRDALAGDEALAERYAGLKRLLAGAHRLDREAYTEAKGDFVRVSDGTKPSAKREPHDKRVAPGDRQHPLGAAIDNAAPARQVQAQADGQTEGERWHS